MRHQNSVFHSLTKHVPWSKFEQIVEKYGADRLVRKLTTKRHLIALLYGQFSGSTSLREVVTGMASHAKAMPIEPGATYVYDLGYYDYGWWARLDEAGCRFVTR